MTVTTTQNNYKPTKTNKTMAIFTDPCPRDNGSTLATLLGAAIASLGPVLVDWMFTESKKR